MDNEKILYSFCKLLLVFKFTNWVMLTVSVLPSWARHQSHHPQTHVRCHNLLLSIPKATPLTRVVDMAGEMKFLLGCQMRWTNILLAQCPHKIFWMHFCLYSSWGPLHFQKECSLRWVNLMRKLTCIQNLYASDLPCLLEPNLIFPDHNHNAIPQKSENHQDLQSGRHGTLQRFPFWV